MRINNSEGKKGNKQDVMSGSSKSSMDFFKSGATR